MHQFKHINDDIYLGPQPTAEDLKQARQKGVKTVIDFRMPNETPADSAAAAKNCGLDYVNIPVNKANLAEDQVDAFDRIMTEKDGPFLIHCASGARAAMLLSLREAKRHQWSAERTFDEVRAMGFDIQGSAEFNSFVQSVTSK